MTSDPTASTTAPDDGARAPGSPGGAPMVDGIGADSGRAAFIAPWWLWLFVAMLALRFVAMWFTVLIPEEAYYWMYAQHPSMGYFDHPPMVALVIGAGTAILGNTEFGVRIAGCLLMLGASVLMYWFGRAWYGRRAALLAALALQVLPAYFATGYIATMDAPLLFFWMVALVGLTLALRNDRAIGWYIAGIGMGGAMMSKYTGVFLGLGGVLACLGCRPWRRQFLTPHPYLGSLVACAIFAPVVVWNSRHDWASFRFQFVERFQGHGFQLSTALEFWGIQLAVATPVVLVAIGWLLARAIRRPRRLRSPRLWFSLCLGMPLLAVMAWKSLRYSTHINWTIPAYLSLLPAAAHLSLAGARRLRVRGIRRDGLREVQWTGVVCVVLCAGAMLYLVLVQPRTRLPRAFQPWPELARIVRDHEAELARQTGETPLVIAQGGYRLASALGFYRASARPLELATNRAGADATTARPTRPTQTVVSGGAIIGASLSYRYWRNLDLWLGADCVCVAEDAEWMTQAAARFDSFESIENPVFAENGLRLAIGRGYRGPTPDVTGRPAPADEESGPP
ncbi:MAG: glycosyltransferase family 39 protein [Phycisphaerales bacterium]